MSKSKKQNDFYKTRNWRNLRAAVYARSGGLCELCKAEGKITAGEIVHHIEHLNEANVDDADIALNEDNLMLVCRDCHAKLHSGRRWRVNAFGQLV